MPRGVYPRKPGLKRKRTHVHPVERIERRLHPDRTDDECWLWPGALSGGGYGHIRMPGKQNEYVHRLLWIAKNGPVPPGCELDHTCRVRRCCNPTHVEPVPHRVNVERGTSTAMRLHLAGVCARGHAADEHACRRKSTGEVVYCRACRRENRARKKAL